MQDVYFFNSLRSRDHTWQTQDMQSARDTQNFPFYQKNVKCFGLSKRTI